MEYLALTQSYTKEGYSQERILNYHKEKVEGEDLRCEGRRGERRGGEEEKEKKQPWCVSKVTKVKVSITASSGVGWRPCGLQEKRVNYEEL